MHARAASVALILLLSLAACGGRTTVERDAEVPDEDAEIEEGDAEVPDEDAEIEEGDAGGTGEACSTDDDCAEGLHCLYWNPGCDQRGVCGAITWGWDTSFSCYGACDCEGYWRGPGLTNFPFQFRDFNGNTQCSPSDAAVTDGWDAFGRHPEHCIDGPH